jgi:hypothetical protein
MRSPLRWHLALLLLSLVVAFPAAAQDDWDDDSDDGGGDRFEALNEYGDAMGNRFLVGLNSWLTFPADPILGLVTPRAEFSDLPGAVITKYPVGLMQGVLLSGYRVVMGFADMTLFWLTPMVMMSPEPHYMLFPGVEHTEY